jgi:K+ transporter
LIFGAADASRGGKRVQIEQVAATFMRVMRRFGYMEAPNVPRALVIARNAKLSDSRRDRMWL